MTTSQTPSTFLSNLNPQDLALIDLLQAERFNPHALINTQNPFHPAQNSLLNLLSWLQQPHIAAAIDSLMAALEALSTKANAHAQLIAKESLTHALAVAASMIPHFDTCPQDPEQAELFAKRAESLIRETRLLARTLLKLSPPPAPRRSRSAASNNTEDNTPDAPASTDDSTSPDADQPASSRPTRASRLNRNSRKPAFSPAEVAEILSALLDHEETHKSHAAATTTPASPSPVPSLTTASSRS
jgi:hypothetical protein